MLKASAKPPCLQAVQRAQQLRDMLANLPPSKRGDHAKRDARRWAQSSFVFNVRPFTRVAKAGAAGTGTSTSRVQTFLLLCPWFEETMDELQRDSVNPVRLTAEATCVLQSGLEAALARMFADANRACNTLVVRRGGRRICASQRRSVMTIDCL